MSCRLYQIQAAIQVRARDGNLLPATSVVDIDCPGGNELAFKMTKVRMEAFRVMEEPDQDVATAYVAEEVAGGWA